MRSPILATPSTKKTFAGLISLWIILLACSIFRPCKMWYATCQMKFSLNLWFDSDFFLISPFYKRYHTARSPPSAYYINMHRVLPIYSKKALLYEITLGESIDARSLTSFKALSFYLALSCIILICFMAKTSLSALCFLTLITLPKLPVPNSFRN